MANKLKNKITGEVISTGYSLKSTYYPWEIVSDTSSEIAIKRLKKQLEHNKFVYGVEPQKG